MSLHRLLRYLNLLVAAILVVALLITYWLLYRPLPKTSGEIQAPISRTGQIVRDGRGVPHISAETVEDALFLQGYAVAQDRLWQLDGLRRLAAGELSEVVGRVAIDTDREARRLRIRRMADQHAAALSAVDREFIAAYVRGVNHFIETHRDNLPIEFTVLRYDPRPFSISDVIAIGLQMYRDLTSSWRDEIQKRNMLEGGEPELVQALFPKRTGTEIQPGSNAWVISGKLTATGKPILAGDPHLEFTNPSTWYMVHLQAPELNVTGVALPGVPGVIIGHNERIAWSVTNLQADVQDLYVEKMNLQTGQYEFQGKVEQARLEREHIAVKGQAALAFDNWVTRHGPVWTIEGNQPLTLKWMAGEPGQFEFPFLQINLARNWTEFRAALKRFSGPGQNFVYADVDGNIGYQATGRLPIRTGYDGDVPVDGSSGKFEWQGYVPFEDMPSSFNPEQGLIVTANQNPFPDRFPHPVSGNFAPPYRANQIRTLLKARTGWKPEDMQAIQKDVYSPISDFIAKQVVAAYEKRGQKNESLDEPVAVLKEWNGQMEHSQAAPYLAVLLYQQLRRQIAERASPGKATMYDYPMTTSVIEKIVRERPEGWFEDYDRVLLRALVDAVEEGRRAQGRAVRNWRYGTFLEVTIRNPIAGRIPYVGRYFDIGPVPMSGSASTVKQTSRRLGPSMRFVANLADWDSSLMNITIGQSGQFLSSHFKDQWEDYYFGRSRPLSFSRVEGRALRVVPTTAR